MRGGKRRRNRHLLLRRFKSTLLALDLLSPLLDARAFLRFLLLRNQKCLSLGVL